MSEKLSTPERAKDEELGQIGLGQEFKPEIDATPTDRKVTDGLSFRALQQFEVTGLGSLNIASEPTSVQRPNDPVSGRADTQAGLSTTCDNCNCK